MINITDTCVCNLILKIVSPLHVFGDSSIRFQRAERVMSDVQVVLLNPGADDGEKPLHVARWSAQ